MSKHPNPEKGSDNSRESGEASGAAPNTSAAKRPARSRYLILVILSGVGLVLAGLYVVLVGCRVFAPAEERSVADLMRAQGGEYEFDSQGHVTTVTTTIRVTTNGGEPEFYRKRDYYSSGNVVKRVVETPTRDTIQEMDKTKGVYGEAIVTRDQVFVVGAPLSPLSLIYAGSVLIGIGLVTVVVAWSRSRRRNVATL